jgi:hypothetical protein
MTERVQTSMVSGTSAQASMVSGPMAPGGTEKSASILEALASAPVDLSAADLERLQAAKR